MNWPMTISAGSANHVTTGDKEPERSPTTPPGCSAPRTGPRQQRCARSKVLQTVRHGGARRGQGVEHCSPMAQEADAKRKTMPRRLRRSMTHCNLFLLLGGHRGKARHDLLYEDWDCAHSEDGHAEDDREKARAPANRQPAAAARLRIRRISKNAPKRRSVGRMRKSARGRCARIGKARRTCRQKPDERSPRPPVRSPC